MRTIALLAGAVAAMALPAFAIPADALTIHLHAQNGSGETGTAVLSNTGSGLRVIINMTPEALPQPAHIHLGSCSQLDPAPKYPLTNVINGHSVTFIHHLRLQQISGSTAINVHKSVSDIATYVSCGNIH